MRSSPPWFIPISSRTIFRQDTKCPTVPLPPPTRRLATVRPPPTPYPTSRREICPSTMDRSALQPSGLPSHTQDLVTPTATSLAPARPCLKPTIGTGPAQVAGPKRVTFAAAAPSSGHLLLKAQSSGPQGMAVSLKLKAPAPVSPELQETPCFDSSDFPPLQQVDMVRSSDRSERPTESFAVAASYRDMDSEMARLNTHAAWAWLGGVRPPIGALRATPTVYIKS
jgi:hypothetical protein